MVSTSVAPLAAAAADLFIIEVHHEGAWRPLTEDPPMSREDADGTVKMILYMLAFSTREEDTPELRIVPARLG